MKKVLSILVLVIAISLGIVSTVNADALYDHEVTFDTNGGEYVHHDIAEFGSKLTSGQPVIVGCEGDSTSDAAGEWFYDAMNSFGSSIEDYSIQYRLWAAGTSNYNTNTNLQYGSDGDAYALMPDASGSYMSTIDSTELSITGDIDLRAKVRVDAGETATVISKWSTAGNYSFYMNYAPSADGSAASILLAWSADGTVALTASSGAYATVNGADTWIRATLDVDNGGGIYVATFYKSTDGVTWTSILAVNGAATTSIFDSAAPVEIGGRNNGTAGFFSGRVYAAEIRSGIAGTIVASPDLDLAFPASISQFKDAEGNAWTVKGNTTVGNGSPGLLVLNGSIAGSITSTYTSNVLDAQLPIEPDLIFINFGHNENLNDDYTDTIENFAEANLSIWPDAAIVLVAQNPQTAPRSAAQIAAHLIRNDQVKVVAARNDFVLVDAYSMLNTDTASYVSADGVHPTVLGYLVWTDLVVDLLNQGFSGGYDEFTILVEDGETIVEPDDPTKTGDTFIGWYRDEALTDEFDMATDTVEADMTLYARYASDTTGSGVITPATDTPSFLGVEWYYWALIGVAVIYVALNNNSVRKAVGLKRKKG